MTQIPLHLQVARILLVSMASFVIALTITPFIMRLLVKYQVKKQIRSEESAPVFHKLHAGKAGTPTMGGIIIWLTVLGLAGILFILAFLFDGFWGNLNFINRAETYLPLAALLIAALLGLLDDIWGIKKIGPKGGGLSMRHKLVVYTLIALLGAWWFYTKLEFTAILVPFVGFIEVGWLAIPIFVFILIASAFSANETDGLDGLAGGVMLFAFAALTVVAFVLGRYHLATFNAALIGALLAFLWFNIYPARFFMGDTGSMALGITMGVTAMLTNTALLLPLFAFILVGESLSVIIQVISKKLRGGKKIFLSSPIHHHFEAKGWPETQVTMRFWIIAALMSGLGLVIFFLERFLR